MVQVHFPLVLSGLNISKGHLTCLPGDVHAGVDHLVEELGRLGDGADGADDAGEARPSGAAEDIEPAEEVDVGRRQPGQLLAGRDITLGEDGLERNNRFEFDLSQMRSRFSSQYRRRVALISVGRPHHPFRCSCTQSKPKMDLYFLFAKFHPRIP